MTQFPDRTAEIAFHREAARKFRAEGNHAGARLSYFKWVESVRQQNINAGGQLEHELDQAKKEQSDFAKIDPTYRMIRDAAIAIIKERPGILQTELYQVLADFEREAIQYAMYFAEDHGVIARSKKGRSYALSLPG